MLPPAPARTLVSISALLLLAGCHGPSQTGIKDRAAAHDRMNLVSAQLGYDQARQAFEAGQLDKALDDITVVVDRYPEKAEFHLLHGRIFLEKHHLEQASHAFLTALEHDSESAPAHYFAGIVYQRWSDDDRALTHYMRASELDDNNVQYLLAAAETLIALQQFVEAKNLVTPRLEFFEHNAAIHQLLGQIALLQDNPTTAAAEYRQAHLLRPEDITLTGELIRIQFDAGLYAPCLATIDQTVRLFDEERDDLLHLRAKCLFLVGRSEESRRQYLELSRRNPTDPDLWSELGAVAWELEDYQRVALCAVRLLALAPDRFEGHLLRGVNERSHGNDAQAIRSLQRAAELSGDSALPHLQLGWVYEEEGRPEEALLAYGEALQRNPEHREARSRFEQLSRRQQVTSVPPDHSPEP